MIAVSPDIGSDVSDLDIPDSRGGDEGLRMVVCDDREIEAPDRVLGKDLLLRPELSPRSIAVRVLEDAGPR